jgi:FemAB-related protein (PEP-CTERM system-associated)
MRVERVADSDSAGEWQREWNRFVAARGASQLGHAAEWVGILRRAYGVSVIPLMARDDAGTIRGVLPLALFTGLRGRKELVSLPYLDAAGPLAADPTAEAALVDAAFAQARECGACAVELRMVQTVGAAPADVRGEGLQDAADGTPSGPDRAAPPHGRVDLRLALESDEEAQWSAIGAKVRNQTRKATKEGLEIGAATGLDAIDAFYEPFCQNMRDLGSPVHGRALFEEVVRAFGDAARVFTCHSAGGGPSVGGLVAIEHAGTVYVPWASTLRSERKRCPNNLIYWEALRWAISRGADTFDFGRSPIGEGTYRFKKGWGAEPIPLSWSRFDAQGRALTVASIGDDPTMRRLSEVWTRLPVALTRLIGPPIRRRLSA